MLGFYVGSALCVAGAVAAIGVAIWTLNPFIGEGGLAFGIVCAEYVNSVQTKALRICISNFAKCQANNNSFEAEIDPHFLLHDLTFYYNTTYWPEVYSMTINILRCFMMMVKDISTIISLNLNYERESNCLLHTSNHWWSSLILCHKFRG